MLNLAATVHWQLPKTGINVRILFYMNEKKKSLLMLYLNEGFK